MSRPEHRHYPHQRWTGVFAACGIVATLLVFIYIIWNPHGEKAAPIQPLKRLVLEIQTVPPPPPPPPPKFERITKQDLVPRKTTMAEPPKVAELSPPLPAPPGTPPSFSAPLGSDGPASPGLGLGGTGGGGADGAGYGAFVSAIKDKLVIALANDATTRFGRYQIRLSLQLSDDGQVELCDALDSSGDANMDRALCRVARQIKTLVPPPMESRGQRVVVRVGATRPAG